jgi:hypothetical protein
MAGAEAARPAGRQWLSADAAGSLPIPRRGCAARAGSADRSAGGVYRRERVPAIRATIATPHGERGFWNDHPPGHRGRHYLRTGRHLESGDPRDNHHLSFNEEKTEASVAIWADPPRKAGHEFFVAERGGARSLALPAMPSSGVVTAMPRRWNIRSSLPRRPGRAGGGAQPDGGGRRSCARAAGAHTLFAAISGENPEGGARLSSGTGLSTMMARLPEAGRKFGRWLDLVLMMKIL